MKIITESADQLIATDKQIGQLIAAPVVALVGVIALVMGLIKQLIPVDAIGAAMLLASVWMFLSRKVRTLTVNKGAGTLNFSLKSIIKSGSYDYSLQDVAKIQMLSQYQTSNVSTGGSGQTTQETTQTTQTTKLVMVLKDGTSLDIADGSRSMDTMQVVSSAPNQKVGERIAQFMGVSFEIVGPGSLNQVVSEITGALQGGTTPVAPTAHVDPPVPPLVAPVDKNPPTK